MRVNNLENTRYTINVKKHKKSLALLISALFILSIALFVAEATNTAKMTNAGDAIIGTISAQNGANTQAISYFKSKTSGCVTDIMAYISGALEGKAIAAIYAVSGGSADTLLEQSGAKGVSPTFSWVDFKLLKPYNVTASTTYGLAVMGNVPINVREVSGTGQRDYNSVSTYAKGFTNPFGPISGTDARGGMSIYAAGTTNSSAPNTKLSLILPSSPEPTLTSKPILLATPTPTAYPTPSPSPAPTSSPTPSPTPVPTPTPTPVTTSTPSPDPTSTPPPTPTATPNPTPTPTPTPTPPVGNNVFSDSFQSGTFSAWSGTNGSPTIATWPVYDTNDSYSANFADTASWNSIDVYKSIGAQSIVYTTLYFQISSLPAQNSGLDLLDYYSGSNLIMRCGIYNSNSAYFFLDTGTTEADAFVIPSTNAWHSLEVGYDNMNNIQNVWLDGTSIINSSVAMGSTVDTVYVGIPLNMGASTNVFIDNVTIMNIAYIFGNSGTGSTTPNPTHTPSPTPSDTPTPTAAPTPTPTSTPTSSGGGYTGTNLCPIAGGSGWWGDSGSNPNFSIDNSVTMNGQPSWYGTMPSSNAGIDYGPIPVSPGDHVVFEAWIKTSPGTIDNGWAVIGIDMINGDNEYSYCSKGLNPATVGSNPSVIPFGTSGLTLLQMDFVVPSTYTADQAAHDGDSSQGVGTVFTPTYMSLWLMIWGPNGASTSGYTWFADPTCYINPS